uniref:Transcriptional coactivator Hfi1/Transcriptional adapter 1 n=1 Tax=Arundo donax TaxID=35708 RepID=A0A0A9D8P2_ARUDO
MPSSVPPPQNLLPLPSPVVGQSSCIDLGEIKLKLVKKIGPERAKKYFEYLQRFLSLKLSKTVFDKLCLTILGENVRLHNHLIRSILHNACHASGPPTVNAPKSIGVAENSNHVLIPPVPVCDNGNEHRHVKGYHPPSRNADASKWRPSLDKGEDVVQENGVAHLTELKRFPRPQQSELVEPLAKRSRVENVYSDLFDSSNSNFPVGVIDRENLEVVARHARGPVTAPLGVDFCSGCFGASWKPLPFSSSAGSDNTIGCYDLGELCDTSSLRRRMGKIAETEGLDGVSLECANSLNNGIDFFLKQLIGSCVELVRARSRNDRINPMILQHKLSGKLINGVQLQSQVHGQSGSTCPQISSISVQDLKAVSELNPQLLGVNGSLLLERMNSYD